MNSDSLKIDIADPTFDVECAPVSQTKSPTRISDFYELTKPRMNMLVVITTMVGFCIASRSGMNWVRLLNTVIGTFLTASSASVLNQFIERKLDALMPRTKNRPLPCKRITPTEALCFGIAAGVAGVAYLALFVNP